MANIGKIPMTQEDRDYFKSGVRTLCGIEVIQAKNIINDPELKVVFTSEDLAFMNKELGIYKANVNIRNIVGGKSKSILSTKQYFFFDFSAELLSSLINSSSLIIWILYSFYR